MVGREKYNDWITNITLKLCWETSVFNTKLSYMLISYFLPLISFKVSGNWRVGPIKDIFSSNLKKILKIFWVTNQSPSQQWFFPIKVSHKFGGNYKVIYSAFNLSCLKRDEEIRSESSKSKFCSNSLFTKAFNCFSLFLFVLFCFLACFSFSYTCQE